MNSNLCLLIRKNLQFAYILSFALFVAPVASVASNNSASYAQVQYPAFDLTDWPKDIIEPLITKHPEILNKHFTALEISNLIKKLQQEMNFNQLKVVLKDNKLYLVGTLNSKVDAIRFKGLKEIDEEEALEILSLNIVDAQDENKVVASLEKLQNYFKNIGYRKVLITSQLAAKSTTSRDLLIDVRLGYKTKISEIKVDGLPPADAKYIERDFTWNGMNAVLSDQTLKNTTRSLRKSLNDLGYYMVSVPQPQISFSADEQKARLLYKLSPEKKYKIRITGQKFQSASSNILSFNVSQIKNEILKLDEYSTNDINFASDLSEKIRLFYISEGYAFCEVPYLETAQGDQKIITLNINEGPLVQIKDIQITGSLSRSKDFYIEKFNQFSSKLVQEKILIQADIEQAAQNLITYLQNEGFVLAKLTRLQVKFEDRKSTQAVILLQIEEGTQATIEKVNITGNEFFSNQKILEIFNFKSGDKLNLIQLQNSLNQLKVFYAENGFIESKILSENKNLVQYSESLTEATLNLDLFEGPQVRVGSVLVEGNRQTHTKLILTELDFKTGDLLTPFKLEESINRLQRTGHFSTIDIYTLEANTDVKERTVVIRVGERKPGVVTSGVGFTNENNLTLQGYAGIAYRNIGGWGRGASLRVEGKYNPDFIQFLESRVTVGYLEPYLFDTRTRFRLNYTSARDVSDLSIRKVTITNQTIWSLEQDFTSHLTGIYEILNVSNFVDRGISPQDEIENNYRREDLVISSTGPTIDLDYRDNILNPKKGHWSRLTLELSSDVLGNHNVDDFFRTTGQSTLYLPLSEKQGLIWANSYRAGYVKSVGRKEFGIPFDKKGFILGGRSTIRGFESSEFFPTTNLQLPASYKLSDYSVFQLIKSELRFPLFGSDNLTAALFYDGGEVLVDNIAFKDRYRDAAGIGLRYNTPVGPLNLEYARKLDRKSYESDGAFHLSVGVF